MPKHRGSSIPTAPSAATPPSTASGRDRDKAWRLLTEAIGMYCQIGIPRHVEMAEALLREL
jgi:hypothetical protein